PTIATGFGMVKKLSRGVTDFLPLSHGSCWGISPGSCGAEAAAAAWKPPESRPAPEFRCFLPRDSPGPSGIAGFGEHLDGLSQVLRRDRRRAARARGEESCAGS